MDNLVSRSPNSARQNLEVNRVSRSDTISTGSPCRRNTTSTKTLAVFSAEILSETGARWTILLNRSTNTRMPLHPCVSLGSPNMKSILTDFQLSDGTANERSGACVEPEGFTRWQTSQVLTYLRTHLYMCGQ